MQAGILAMAGIIVRIIGLLYRSPLTAIIGDEGNGYYGYAYNCYAIALLISSYSIPSAISRLIAAKLAVGQYENAQRYFRAALRYVIVVGGITCLILFIFAPVFVTDATAAPVLRIFAPTVFLFGILGVFRGYFQAHKTMVPTSVSQILEQFANAFISIFAALAFTKIASGFAHKSLADTGALMLTTGKLATDTHTTTRAVYGAAGSALGTGAGVLVALLFMTAIYMANKQMVADRIFLDVHKRIPMSKITGTLIAYVTPFILSTLVYNMTKLLDQTIFTRIMIFEKGMAESNVAIEYGIFSGKAVVLSEIPIAVAAAVSAAMIPEIATKYARRKFRSARLLCNQVIRVTMLVAIPAAAGMMVLARPVTMLLFPQKASLDRASVLLAILAVTIVFYALSTLTNAILQGAEHVWTPAVNSLIAIVIQAVILAVLLKTTGLYTYALAIALIIHSVLLTLFNHISIRRYRLAELDFIRVFGGPLIASAGMAIVTFAFYQLLNLLLGLFMSGYMANLFALLPAILMAVWLYAMILVRAGFIGEDDIDRFPGGHKLKKLLILTHVIEGRRQRGYGNTRGRNGHSSSRGGNRSSRGSINRRGRRTESYTDNLRNADDGYDMQAGGYGYRRSNVSTPSYSGDGGYYGDDGYDENKHGHNALYEDSGDDFFDGTTETSFDNHEEKSVGARRYNRDDIDEGEDFLSGAFGINGATRGANRRAKHHAGGRAFIRGVSSVGGAIGDTGKAAFAGLKALMGTGSSARGKNQTRSRKASDRKSTGSAAGRSSGQKRNQTGRGRAGNYGVVGNPKSKKGGFL